MVFAVVTGGGTSGHVIPARSIIEGLIESGVAPAEIRYVGSRRGVEGRLMADAGVECEFLPISGLQRGISFNALRRNLTFPARVLRSRWLARKLVAQWAPRVVVSLGGYASDPMSSAAVVSGVPLVCVSYDRVPGLATRRQAKKATVSAVAFEGSPLPRAIVTGAPVRSELRHLDVVGRRSTARKTLSVDENAVSISIVGGSLGSAVLNHMVDGLLVALGEDVTRHVVVYHVCGERFLAEPSPAIPTNVTYRRVGYEEHMADLYSATDILVSRAGASSVAEIATVGVCAVLVPWSGAAEDHQTLNARWLGDADAALVFSEEACVSGVVVDAIVALVGDEIERRRLAAQARSMGALHRGDSLVEVIKNAAR